MGHFVPSVPMMAVYTSSKHAVTAFTTALGDELGHSKARIKTTVSSLQFGPLVIIECVLESLSCVHAKTKSMDRLDALDDFMIQ